MSDKNVLTIEFDTEDGTEVIELEQSSFAKNFNTDMDYYEGMDARLKFRTRDEMDELELRGHIIGNGVSLEEAKIDCTVELLNTIEKLKARVDRINAINFGTAIEKDFKEPIRYV